MGYERAFGKISKFAKQLWTWVEAGTVKTKNSGTPMLANQGIVCLLIGDA